MMTETTPYETLFETMKNGFTVLNDKKEYTLGAFMRLKAKDLKANSNAVMIEVSSKPSRLPLRALFNTVSEKLSVKNPPKQEKIIGSFPLRTSLTAFFSALMICFTVFSFGMLSKQSEDTPAFIASQTVTESETLTAKADTE